MHNSNAAGSYITPKQAAQYLGFSTRTLIEWRRTGRGPAYVRMGKLNGRVRYSVHELDRWMAARAHAHTAAEQVRSAGR